MISKVLFLIVPLITSSSGLIRGPSYEVFWEWKQIDYNFPNNTVREQLIQNGGFKQINCALTSLKVFGDKVFVMTPRYETGVPYTLSIIPYRKSYVDNVLQKRQGPKLIPFPSPEMQEIGNCGTLQNVPTVELDPYGRLWVVDVGRVDSLTKSPRNLCPAKLVIMDSSIHNSVVRLYEFPNGVVPRDSNFIKDLQLDCSSPTDCFAYISNVNGSSIVVYDYKSNDSWRASHPSMQPDLEKADLTVEGTSLTVPFGVTGLGLTPKSTGHSTLYFSKIAGDHVYRINTTILKNPRLKLIPYLQDNQVEDIGAKSSAQADGAAMDNRGRWYFGSLPESAVYMFDTTGNPSTLPPLTKVVQSRRDMQWPDTFSFDEAGSLAFITPRFQLFDSKTINPNEINYRLIRFKTDSLSYIN